MATVTELVGGVGHEVDTAASDTTQQTVNPPNATGRKICVVGFADTSRDIANHQPKDVEIWALNRTYTILRTWSRWYEMHERDVIMGHNGLREPEYIDLLRKSKVPVYMQYPDPTIPNALPLPREEIVERWRDYFTSSIAYMLAHAALEHVNGDTIEELLMVGVDMSAFTEYSQQRPCVEYWLGVLEGLGITVTIPLQSPVLKTAISYGRREEWQLWAIADERIKSLKSDQAQMGADVQGMMGAVQEYSNLKAMLDQLRQQIGEKTFSEVEEQDAGAKAICLEIVGAVQQAYRARQDELSAALAQLNADLNGKMGALREAQSWLTLIGAPQKEEHEPVSMKKPQPV